MKHQYELVDKLKSYDPNADEDLVKRAYALSMEAHKTQVRESGDPYFSHPLEVAGILTDLKLDAQSIATALLHDTVEDTHISLEDISRQFGADVAKLVDGVSKLSRLELQSEETKQAENFRKLLLAMSADIRVLLIKLADRLHNMRTITHVRDESKRRRIARETIDIYAPLAERMGMHTIKDELEDLAFAQLNPEMYTSITTRLKFLHASSQDAIGTIIEDLKRVLKEGDLTCNISGRLKTPYSIWRKMQRKNITFEQLSDIMAFRIVVDDLPACYQALGTMHSHYRVVPGRFKDYISTPKANNYRSLHTGIIGPLNQRIEIQIRTKEMHTIADFGVAAHWQYKRGEQSHDGRQYAWLRSLLEILEHASGPEEFLEHTKLEMFNDQVFCFTPKGELIPLPKGATPVDFAYAIHSQVGNHTVGAKINGKQLPLRTTLNNGDQVEIITSKTQTPSPTWERFVITGKARAGIRRYVRTQQREQFCDLGRSLLQKACVKENLLFCDKAFTKVCSKFQQPQVEDIYASIGSGLIHPRDVLQAAYPDHFKKMPPAPTTELGESASQSALAKKTKASGQGQLSIQGLIPGMALHLAGCCHPLPGDKIVGVVITGKGITIHTHDCESLHMIDNERLMDLAWSDELGELERHVGRLRVSFMNRPGSLANMTTAISKHSGNIVNLKITHRSAEFWDLMVDVEVRDVEHLNNIMAALRSVSLITSVQRV